MKQKTTKLLCLLLSAVMLLSLAACKKGGGKSSGKQQDAENYTSSTALRLASASSASTQGQLMALESMYENGNITKKQYSDLVYALKNPGK